MFNGHKKAVSYVKFLSPNELASASTDSTLRLWDVKENRAVCSERLAVSLDWTKSAEMECFYVVYIYASTCGAEGLIGYGLWLYIVILVLDIHRVFTLDMLKKVIY